MLCGIKWWACISKKNAYKIIEKANLKVTSEYNTKREVLNNGEPKTFTKHGKYRGWHIKVRKESTGYKLEVRGSLHKFHLGNNAGSFTGLEVVEALEKMYTLFDVDPAKINIQNVEVGINLPVSFRVYQYLVTNLLFHKKKTREDSDLKGIGFVFLHDDYLLKLYQKEERKLRFEIRYTSQDKITGFGIHTCADLHEVTTNRLVESLLPEWQQVIMKDGVDFFNEKENASGLTKDQLHKLHKFTSIGYQQDYKRELTKARLASDRKRCNSLRIAANRLHQLCMSIIKERGDQVHSRLEQQIASRIDGFKGTWKENVTVSPYDKAREIVTDTLNSSNEILSITDPKRYTVAVKKIAGKGYSRKKSQQKRTMVT